MAPNYDDLKLAKEYNDTANFVGPETSYSSDYKWKMNTDFLKSSVARRLPNGHNPHPRDARFISWFTENRVCNMSTYDRPLTGYTHAPRSRREMLTTSSLCYQPPPPESYRARTAGTNDRAALLSSNGVKCALSTYSQPTRAFSADQSYRIKVELNCLTKEEVQKLKMERLEKERDVEQLRYRASLKRQMENSKYDFSLIPFVHRNTEVCHPQARRMIKMRINSTVPGLVK
ncbi:hypothetical protein ACHWQZ_G007298 [Mnemiopsis leidyi]